MRQLVLAIALTALLAGCVAWEREAAEMRADNIARMDSYMEEAAINAVLAERTLYPYHFYHGTPQLTELGVRHLTILAAYYSDHPGPLIIRQRDASDELYARRVEEVRGRLGDWGIALEEVLIEDAYPRGPGIASQRVYHMLESDEGLTASEGLGVQ